MLLAATLSLVLFCAVSLTALVTFAILLYIRANKKGNPAAKSNGDDRRVATKEIEEVYYATVKSSNHDDGTKETKEIEKVYYTAVKSKGDDGSKVTKEIEEVYYSTIDLSTCAVDPQMEKNCAYGDICIHT